ncbi:MAG TPA: M23 family metallopeptidase [Pyrinomonadaceae bacterium]|nr:M23 family metallopeptidase [Pyrinomonadaceae bacterium]
MENNFFAAIFNKLKVSQDAQNQRSFKDFITKAAPVFFVSSVFLIAVAFLVYNSINALTIWGRNSNSNPSVVQSSNVVRQDTGRNNELDFATSLRKSRPDTSIYRNGKDLSGGIQFSTFPVRGGRVTAGYGIRNNPFDEFGFTEFHSGIDIGIPQGTPVLAAAKGVVTHSGWAGGYGNVVIIEHDGSDVITRYAHLSRCDVAVGQTVNKGSQIGLVGSTGRSTGPHLHYEVRINGRAVDPLSVYPGRRRI